MRHFVISSLITVLNFNALFAFDSIITSLDFENKPSIDYYSKILKESGFHDSSDTLCYGCKSLCLREFWINPSDYHPSFHITISHTPISRRIYNIHIKGTAYKSPFVSQLLEFYTDIIYKYGLPDSAYYRPNSIVDSDDEKDYFPVDSIGGNDTIKIKQFIEQSKPFGIIWTKGRYIIRLEVREGYQTRHMTDFYCSINDNEAEKVYINEKGIIETEKQAKEKRNKIITIVLLTICGIAFFFIARKGYMKIREREEKRKSIQKAENERCARTQQEIDVRHNEYKNQLIEKYGAITRIISNTRYDCDFIKYYDDIIVFKAAKKIIFGRDEFDFADILSCSMYDENHKDIPPIQVTRTNTGSMLGRAAVGGLTLGIAGAVVGAMTAKTESTSYTDNPEYLASYVVKIGIKSIERPTLSLKYGINKSKAEEVYALMQAIIAMK